MLLIYTGNGRYFLELKKTVPALRHKNKNFAKIKSSLKWVRANTITFLANKLDRDTFFYYLLFR